MHRIGHEDSKISWKDFRKKYWGFFPLSSEVEQDAKLREEFKRFTGKDAPSDGKDKGTDSEITDVKSKKDGGVDAPVNKG